MPASRADLALLSPVYVYVDMSISIDAPVPEVPDAS